MIVTTSGQYLYHSRWFSGQFGCKGSKVLLCNMDNNGIDQAHTFWVIWAYAWTALINIAIAANISCLMVVFSYGSLHSKINSHKMTECMHFSLLYKKSSWSKIMHPFSPLFEAKSCENIYILHLWWYSTFFFHNRQNVPGFLSSCESANQVHCSPSQEQLRRWKLYFLTEYSTTRSNQYTNIKAGRCKNFKGTELHRNERKWNKLNFSDQNDN